MFQVEFKPQTEDSDDDIDLNESEEEDDGEEEEMPDLEDMDFGTVSSVGTLMQQVLGQRKEPMLFEQFPKNDEAMNFKKIIRQNNRVIYRKTLIDQEVDVEVSLADQLSANFGAMLAEVSQNYENASPETRQTLVLKNFIIEKRDRCIARLQEVFRSLGWLSSFVYEVERRIFARYFVHNLKQYLFQIRFLSSNARTVASFAHQKNPSADFISVLTKRDIFPLIAEQELEAKSSDHFAMERQRARERFAKPDPTLIFYENEFAVKCTTCLSRGFKDQQVDVVEKQIHSSDEPSTLFCKCRRCGRDWRG